MPSAVCRFVVSPGVPVLLAREHSSPKIKLTATCLQEVLHRVGFLIDCFSKEFAIDATITNHTMSQINSHTKMRESYRMTGIFRSSL